MTILKLIYRNARMMRLRHELENRYQREGSHEPADLLYEAQQSGAYTLFITNDNAGGTRQFEMNFLKMRKRVIVLRRLSYGERPDLMYELTDHDSGTSLLLHLRELDPLWHMEFSEIIVNTLVHVTNIRYFMHHLIEYRREHKNCRTIVMVHDYHCVCPNCNLYANGHYCRLQCRSEQCRLYLADWPVDNAGWRSMWERFLACATEIRCFSESSRQIILEAYGYNRAIADKLTVVPHDLSFISFTPVQGTEKLPFCLGIIGDCNADIKGRQIVKQVIRKFGNTVPIVLIGSDFRHYLIRRKKVKYLGPYRHGDLQKMIEREKVTDVLFPSPWPETFSYLVSEIMAMQLPIICFDFGAQAEKASSYPGGTICHTVDDMLQVIREWAEQRAQE